MGNNEDRLSEEEERSCKRIEEALELYEANGEDALKEIAGMLSKEENRSIGYSIDETSQEAEENWAQAF